MQKAGAEGKEKATGRLRQDGIKKILQIALTVEIHRFFANDYGSNLRFFDKRAPPLLLMIAV